MQLDGLDRSITVSIGMSAYPDDAGEELALLRRPDRALNAAKHNGRDRVEMVSTAGLPEAEAPCA